MKTRAAFAAVVLASLGLLVWLATSTRYYQWDNSRGVVYRDDGWTGMREIQLCTDEHHGGRVIHACHWARDPFETRAHPQPDGMRLPDGAAGSARSP